MENILLPHVAPEIRGLLQDCAWQIVQTAENITVFSKSLYTIYVSGYNQNWNNVPLCNKEDVMTARNIRFLEISKIVCAERYTDMNQLHRIMKNLASICDTHNITLYVNIDDQYKNFEEFQGRVADYNQMEFSLTIKDKIPFCVRFHKNEKHLFLPISPKYISEIVELTDQLNLYATTSSTKYAFSTIIDDIFAILSINKKTYKDAIIIEKTLESLRQFLSEDNLSYGLYQNELDRIDEILSSIRTGKSFIL